MSNFLGLLLKYSLSFVLKQAFATSLQTVSLSGSVVMSASIYILIMLLSVYCGLNLSILLEYD